MKYFLFLIPALLSSCSSDQKPPNENTCSLQTLESELTSALDSSASSTDFSFYIERSDGESYSYNRGASSLDSAYESASTSKWVSAAIILWAIDQTSNLDLSDNPNEHYTWSMSPADPLYSLTLGQLLSFTSGLQGEANCLQLGVPAKTYDACINDSTNSLVNSNEGNGYSPGVGFYYSSSHLQLAGAIAASASPYSDWQGLFSAFQTTTGLLQNSTYSLPSSVNPRLAGGMTWTGRDYIDFLRAIYRKAFLSASSHEEMFKDKLIGLNIQYSPASDNLGEQWHYGYGVWLECRNPSFNCTDIDYYSSPGAFGAYPFINFNKNFFGLVARQGALGTYPEGINLYRGVQSLAESWAECN